jgi:hypothetical protein
MTANIFENKMVYSSKNKMWHGMGTVSLTDKTAVEVLLEDFDGGFTVETRPVTVLLNGEAQETGDYAIVRSRTNTEGSKELVFGYCSEKYHPIQPMEIAETFDANVAKYVETMGFLGDGNDMFVSWKMPEFDVNGDPNQMYGIIRSGFDSMKGTSLFSAIYRPVCENTINLAQNWAKSNTDGKGRGEIFNGKHVNKNLLRDLGYWAKYAVQQSERSGTEIKEMLNAFAAHPVKNDKEVMEILWLAFPDKDALGEYYAPELRGAKETAIATENGKTSAIRENIFSLFAGRGTKITPDYWGIMNATSEFFCHYLPSKKPIASSVMFGNRSLEIAKMVNVLKERVTA